LRGKEKLVRGANRLLLALLLLVAVSCGSGGTKAPAKVFRIGVYHVGLDHIPPSFPAMKEALARLGYVDGKNIIVEWHNLADEAAADVQARAFVAEKVDLIVAFENQTARASLRATKSIPILVLHVTNAVEEGFVKSLAHPGGNVTGTVGFRDLPAKQLEKLLQVAPKVRRVLVVTDPKDPVTPGLLAKAKAAAVPLGLTLVERHATSEADLRAVLAAGKKSADAVLLVSPTLQTKFSSVAIAESLKHHLAYESVVRQWVERGSLLSYGPDQAKIGREAAQYVVKILKGAAPADLPVVELTQLELAINLKTAKTIGVTVPQAALDVADYVVR
jgi:putative ABC transport system substrate-binding protein